jgi:transcriptional regulator with XRE-family HTH domain
MGQEGKPNVGPRLRSFREQQGYSLRALAERCGLSINAISRIERGENSPTVSSLHRLAYALSIPITDFFLEPSRKAALLVRKGYGQRYDRACFAVEQLSMGFANKDIEPLLLEIQPECDHAHKPLSHEGEEFVYCLEGAVEYCVGDEIYRLQAGDSLLFEASQQHFWRNAGPETARILLVFYAGQDGYQARQHHITL